MDGLFRSWTLLKACGRVLDADRELLVFPALSGTAALIAAVGILVPTFGVSMILPEDVSTVAFVVGVFALALVQSAVMIYFQAALVGAALIRMEGRDPTLSDGLAAANAHLNVILQWSAVSAVVGAILQAMSRNRNGMGRTLPMLAGMAWNVATFLVVPVLVAEGLGPFDALQRSAGLLKQTWGEQIGGSLGIGGVFGFAMFLWGALTLGGGVYVAGAGLVSLGVALAIVGVMGLLVLMTAQTAMNGIYRAAVYRYATHGDVELFKRDELAIPR